MTKLAAVAFAMLIVVFGSGPGDAQTAIKHNWIPVAVGDRAFGDLWTFTCPAGGSFELFVDTVDQATGSIDPAAFVFDGQGNFLSDGDNEVACTFPTCAGSCPFVQGSCGAGGPHSIGVFNAINSSLVVPSCIGGGYGLVLNVFNRQGQPLTEHAIKLGGGPQRRVPAWMVDQGAAATGPALDDEGLPF